MEKELKILSESLKQKCIILNGLLVASKSQEDILKKVDPDLEAFDSLVDKKDKMIDSIERLDEGFEVMYEKLSLELKDNRLRYQNEIAELKQLVSRVTGLSVQIQEQENKNKQLMDDFFVRRRKEIRTGRQNSRAVLDYYKNMSSSAGVSTFMDSKHYRE